MEAEELVEPCLKCGMPIDKFKELSEEEANKVYGSERTNDLLMQLDNLSMKLVEICDEGIEIGLDPACIKLFEYTNDEAWKIKQLAKSEIENHVNKGKW
jgi:hypothetical protein